MSNETKGIWKFNPNTGNVHAESAPYLPVLRMGYGMSKAEFDANLALVLNAGRMAELLRAFVRMADDKVTTVEALVLSEDARELLKKAGLE